MAFGRLSLPLPIVLAALLLRLPLRKPTAAPPRLTMADQVLVISPGDAQSAEEAARLADTCAALAKRGVRRLLLREPHLTRRQLERLVHTLRPLYPEYGLFVHEKCAGASTVAAANGLGLHLASTSDWRERRAQFRGPLGVSAHSEEEVEFAAACGCQYAFLSPVSRPTSKPGDARPPIGEAAILRAQRALPELDVVALGGVTPSSAARLASGGGRGVAVLGGVFSGGSATPVEEACMRAAAYLEAVCEVTRSFQLQAA